MITAVLIDNREPKWVQELKFGGVPTSVAELPEGDVWAICSDGMTLKVERKTPGDLLNTLAEDRFFPQMVKLSDERTDALLEKRPVAMWPYLVVTGPLVAGPDGLIVTDQRVSSWSLRAVMGALLSAQEMGVMVTFAESDKEFEATILSLGNRERKNHQYVLPPRVGISLGPGFALLASLPGIGPERVMSLMNWAGNRPAAALAGLTDLDIECPPINDSIRKKARNILGLKDTEWFDLSVNSKNQETLVISERK